MLRLRRPLSLGGGGSGPEGSCASPLGLGASACGLSAGGAAAEGLMAAAAGEVLSSSLLLPPLPDAEPLEAVPMPQQSPCGSEEELAGRTHVTCPTSLAARWAVLDKHTSNGSVEEGSKLLCLCLLPHFAEDRHTSRAMPIPIIAPAMENDPVLHAPLCSRAGPRT